MTINSLDVLLSNFEPICCPISCSVSPWPEYQFFRRQVRWSGNPISLGMFHSLLWSTQSILKEISPEYSLEGLMLNLKLQYFGHLMRRTDSLEKTLMLGKIEGQRRIGQQRIRWLEGITDMWVWVNSWSWWWTVRLVVVGSMGSPRVGHDWATELNWTYLQNKKRFTENKFIVARGNVMEKG